MNSQRPLPSRLLVELLSRALLDVTLCDCLFAEPDAVAEAFGVNSAESEAIKRLDRREFEQRVMQMRSA